MISLKNDFCKLLVLWSIFSKLVHGRVTKRIERIAEWSDVLIVCLDKKFSEIINYCLENLNMNDKSLKMSLTK